VSFGPRCENELSETTFLQLILKPVISADDTDEGRSDKNVEMADSGVLEDGDGDFDDGAECINCFWCRLEEFWRTRRYLPCHALSQLWVIAGEPARPQITCKN